MTDEQLIEKMAEAMWNTPPDPCRHSWAQIINLPFAEPAMTAELMRKRARAALSVVRDHDKQGSVHAQSTGGEQSSDQMKALSDAMIYGQGYLALEPDGTMTRLDPKNVMLKAPPIALPREGAAQAETGKDATGTACGSRRPVRKPIVDRSAPAAHREEDDLPHPSSHA